MSKASAFVLAVLVTLPLAAAPPKPAPQEVRYGFLFSGNRAGEAVATVEANGDRVYTFEFNDRGRVPSLRPPGHHEAPGTRGGAGRDLAGHAATRGKRAVVWRKRAAAADDGEMSRDNGPSSGENAPPLRTTRRRLRTTRRCLEKTVP